MNKEFNKNNLDQAFENILTYLSDIVYRYKNVEEDKLSIGKMTTDEIESEITFKLAFDYPKIL